jgi:hypothetical protein
MDICPDCNQPLEFDRCFRCDAIRLALKDETMRFALWSALLIDAEFRVDSTHPTRRPGG